MTLTGHAADDGDRGQLGVCARGLGDYAEDYLLRYYRA
jgi:hypothetical protein